MDLIIWIALVLLVVIIIIYLLKNNENRKSQAEIKKELLDAIEGNFAIKIKYKNFKGELRERQITKLEISNEYKEFGYMNQHFKGFCHYRNEERTFKIDRIKSIEIIK